MLNSFPVTMFVATTLGFLSGLGIGGGSLLVLWLTIVLGTDPQIARSVNLLFFIPSALISCALRLKKGQLNLRPFLPVILSGCVASAAFSWISTVVEITWLKKSFGIILIAAGIKEICYRNEEKGSSE